MQLAEESLTRTTASIWLKRAGVALVLLGAVAALTTLAMSLVSAPTGAKRQVAKISILPDTPPPPPPPREEPKKEPPKTEARPTPQEQPKPQPAPPQNEPIKMEGTAGEGPSAFSAGTVTKDYQGGPPGTGASAPATVADRANERLYANTARQLLRDEIERQLKPDAGQLTATFAVWIEADGRIGRCELQPSGDASRDVQMQGALDGVSRALRLPPPPAIAQPMRFRLTVRAQG